MYLKRLSEGILRRVRKLSNALGQPRAESVRYALDNIDAYPGAVRCECDEWYSELLP